MPREDIHVLIKSNIYSRSSLQTIRANDTCDFDPYMVKTSHRPTTINCKFPPSSTSKQLYSIVLTSGWPTAIVSVSLYSTYCGLASITHQKTRMSHPFVIDVLII